MHNIYDKIWINTHILNRWYSLVHVPSLQCHKRKIGIKFLTGFQVLHQKEFYDWDSRCSKSCKIKDVKVSSKQHSFCLQAFFTYHCLHYNLPFPFRLQQFYLARLTYSQTIYQCIYECIVFENATFMHSFMQNHSKNSNKKQMFRKKKINCTFHVIFVCFFMNRYKTVSLPSLKPQVHITYCL